MIDVSKVEVESKLKQLTLVSKLYDAATGIDKIVLASEYTRISKELEAQNIDYHFNKYTNRYEECVEAEL